MQEQLAHIQQDLMQSKLNSVSDCDLRTLAFNIDSLGQPNSKYQHKFYVEHSSKYTNQRRKKSPSEPDVRAKARNLRPLLRH